MSNSSVWPWTLNSLNPTPPIQTEFEIGNVLHTWDFSPAAIECETEKTIGAARTAYDIIGSLANCPDGALSYVAVIKVIIPCDFDPLLSILIFHYYYHYSNWLKLSDFIVVERTFSSFT